MTILLIKDLLVNLLFILLFIGIIPLALEYLQLSKEVKRKLWLVSLMISIMLTMIFTIRVSDGTIIDLRAIPMIIGGLYGGLQGCLIMLVTVVSTRVVLGGEGVLGAIVIGTITISVIALFHKKFQKFSFSKKIVYAGLLGLAEVVALERYATIFLGMDLSSSLLFYLSAFHIVGMITAVFLYEFVISFRHINKRMIRTEKLEAVSHLSSSISHEIRNPLTAIKGFLQLIDDDKLSKEKRKAFLKIATTELNRADNIISDYLMFAKPTPEKLDEINLREELRYVVEVIKPMANMNSVRIETSLKSFNIIGEKEKFHQAIINILKNSIEAMPSGGNLSVHMGLNKRGINIRIRDTGCGMTIEQVRRLGEPYFTTKGQKGTGLGMMVAFSVITALGGKMKVKSEVGKGSTFVISLPIKTTIPPLTTIETSKSPFIEASFK